MMASSTRREPKAEPPTASWRRAQNAPDVAASLKFGTIFRLAPPRRFLGSVRSECSAATLTRRPFVRHAPDKVSVTPWAYLSRKAFANLLKNLRTPDGR